MQTGEIERRGYQGESACIAHALTGSDKVVANPSWPQIAGKFVGPYLENSTDAFYQQYPSPALFPITTIPSADPTETEECLFLDVLVPEPVFRTRQYPGKKAPVLVWIYGGGYSGGYKNQYGPAALLEQSYNGPTDGVIFVALSSRVSTFQGPILCPVH